MKPEEILSNEHLDNPQGNNGLGAYGLFYWRDLYRSFIYPEEMVEEPIDLWYDRVFYGRVDTDGYSIYPSEKYLKQITATDTLFAVNFVADAYEDFKKFMETAITRGDVVPLGSLYGTIDPKKAWYSLHGLYHDWNQAQYDLFAGSFMTTSRDEKILNFKGFVKVYLEFVDSIGHMFPMTREHWLLSHWCPPGVSGLTINLVDAPPDLDDLKAEFLKDTNFYFFSSAANRFGFKVDKNAPWHMVADINSKPMQKYMRRYGKNRKTMFKTQYFKTYKKELETFKHYLWGWYNEYVTANPMAKLNRAASCSRATASGLVEREKLTEDQALAKYPDEYWLRLYSYIRGIETRRTWNQSKFDRVVKKTLTFDRLKGRDVAMKYLHKELTLGKKSTFSSSNDLTRQEVDVILRQNKLARHFGEFIF